MLAAIVEREPRTRDKVFDGAGDQHLTGTGSRGHPSADVDALAVGIVRGAYEYQGQKCSAASRASS